MVRRVAWFITHPNLISHPSGVVVHPRQGGIASPRVQVGLRLVVRVVRTGVLQLGGWRQALEGCCQVLVNEQHRPPAVSDDGPHYAVDPKTTRGTPHGLPGFLHTPD